MQHFEDFGIFLITVLVSFCYCCEVFQKDFKNVNFLFWDHKPMVDMKLLELLFNWKVVNGKFIKNWKVPTEKYSQKSDCLMEFSLVKIGLKLHRVINKSYYKNLTFSSSGCVSVCHVGTQMSQLINNFLQRIFFWHTVKHIFECHF